MTFWMEENERKREGKTFEKEEQAVQRPGGRNNPVPVRKRVPKSSQSREMTSEGETSKFKANAEELHGEQTIKRFDPAKISKSTLLNQLELEAEGKLSALILKFLHSFNGWLFPEL